MDKKSQTLIRKFLSTLFFLFSILHADIGHNNVVYEGMAGEIPIRVLLSSLELFLVWLMFQLKYLQIILIK